MKSILAQDHYELLEVHRFAPKSDIVKAYHRLKSAFDPDSVATYSLFSADELRMISARVDEAFRVLIDERKKELYDKWLDAKSRGENLPEPAFARDPAGEQVAAAALATSGTTDIKPFIPRKPPVLRPVPSGGFPAVSVNESRPMTPPPVEPPPAPKVSPPPAAPVPAPPPVDEDALRQLMASDHERDGAWFRSIREARGFTLQQVAEKTKINQMYMRFIEDNNYRDMPAPVYLRGFLVQMSRFYKLEAPDQIAEAYMALMERRKREST